LTNSVKSSDEFDIQCFLRSAPGIKTKNPSSFETPKFASFIFVRIFLSCRIGMDASTVKVSCHLHQSNPIITKISKLEATKDLLSGMYSTASAQGNNFFSVNHLLVFAQYVCTVCLCIFVFSVHWPLLIQTFWKKLCVCLGS
jgi:hypothetical protein